MTISSVSEAIKSKIFSASDIRQEAPVFGAIERMLAGYEVDCPAWQFGLRTRSRYARSNADGSTEVVPYLTLIMRHTEDISVQGIDPAKGNWDDAWALTAPIRNDLNDILRQHGMDKDAISDRSFIFAGQSFDHLCRDALGRDLKVKVRDIAITSVPPLTAGPCVPKYLFWQSGGLYSLIYEDEATYEQVIDAGQSIADQVNDLFDEHDPERALGMLSVAIDILHMGMKDLNLHGLSRED